MADPSSCQEVPGPGGEAKRGRNRGEEDPSKLLPRVLQVLALGEKVESKVDILTSKTKSNPSIGSSNHQEQKPSCFIIFHRANLLFLILEDLQT